MTDVDQELAAAHRAIAARDAEIAELRSERQKPLRLKQAAAALGLSEKTIRRRAKQGLASKAGGKGPWLFDQSTIAALMGGAK